MLFITSSQHDALYGRSRSSLFAGRAGPPPGLAGLRLPPGRLRPTGCASCLSLKWRRPVVGEAGRLIALLGIVLLVMGGMMMLFGRLNLPGDFVWRRGNVTVVLPL